MSNRELLCEVQKDGQCSRSIIIQSGVCGDFCVQEDNDNISVPFYVCVQPFTHFGLVLCPDAPFGYYILCMTEIAEKYRHANQVFFMFTWFGNDILIFYCGTDLSTVACGEIPHPKFGLWLSSHSGLI